MKKLPILLAAAMLSSTVSCFAYESKADELYSLIDRCKAKGINTQYEEIDANIIKDYAEKIPLFESKGLDSSVTEFQKTELDRLYEGAKENLTSYLNGERAPKTVYDYKTGDGFSINGASMLNKNGIPYYSTGFGHFNMTGELDNLQSYGYDNIQFEIGVSSIVSGDGKIDNWSVYNNGVTSEAEVVDGALHITNDRQTAVSNEYTSVTQLIAVRPNTQYEIGCRIKGTSSGNFYTEGWNHAWKYFSTSADKWTDNVHTITTGSDEHIFELMFIISQACDLYIDDVYVREVGSTKNLVKNADFSGDGHDRFDIRNSNNSNHYYMRKLLYEAESTNNQVCVLLSPHYFPENFKSSYPELYASNGMGYVIDHELAREVVEAYIRDVMVMLEDYPAVSSICLSNEPSYNTALSNGYYDQAFRDYLIEKHGTISNLNKTYNLSDGWLGGMIGKTSYDSFDDIEMPTEVASSGLFYDWKMFNDKVFADWHAWMAGIVKEYTDIPVHVKTLQYFYSTDHDSMRDAMQRGTDIELFNEFSDFAGNDCGTYLDSEGGAPMITMTKWYDFLDSTTDKAIYNSEDHITMDGSTLFNEDMKKHTSSALWQGAVHGRDMSTIWTWGYTTDKSSLQYGHLGLRPESVSSVSKASLDLNRLSYEVSAIANRTPDVAILFSNASRVHEKYHVNAIDVAYKAAMYAGKKVGFVTDRNIAEKLGQYETLIIPVAEYVPDAVYNAIVDFKANGGKLVIIGANSLLYNEYGTKRDNSAAKQDVSVISSTVKDKNKISSPTIETLRDMFVEDSIIKVVDANTGELAEGIEWQYAPYKGGYIVNIYNYGDAKNLQVLENGELCYDYKELISNTNVTDTVSLGYMERNLMLITDVTENEFFAGTTEQKGSLLVCSGTASNPYDYEVTAKIIITAYNEDGSFAGASEIKKNLPAGAQSDFYAEFSVEGKGRTVVRYE